jgi:hypothetical protein
MWIFLSVLAVCLLLFFVIVFRFVGKVCTEQDIEEIKIIIAKKCLTANELIPKNNQHAWNQASHLLREGAMLVKKYPVLEKYFVVCDGKINMAGMTLKELQELAKDKK